MSSNFPAAQVAQLISGPNLTPESARLRFKNFVASHYIPTRDRSQTDKRGTLLFSPGDVLTAAILSEMVDLGGLSREAMQAAATRLHAWGLGELPERETDLDAAAAADQRQRRESPANWMTKVFADDPANPPGFTLRLSWRKSRSGNVTCAASISHGNFGELGAGLTATADSVPVADLLLPIDPILLETHARIERLKVAH